MSTASLAQGKQLLELFSGATSAQVKRVIENGDLIRILLTADLKSVDRAAFEALLLADPLDRYAAKIFSLRYWLDVLRLYNVAYWDNRFTREDFAAARTRLALIPDDHVQSVKGLFGFHVVSSSFAETIEMWTRVFKGELPNFKLRDELQFDDEHFRLNGLAETYEPGIHLVWANLVAHWEPKDGRTIDEVCIRARAAGENLAQLELLSIWGVLTDLFQCQDGIDLPFTDMAGTEVTIPDASPSNAWRDVLCLRGDREEQLFTGLSYLPYRRWAAPVVRKV